ncbi:MAG: histidinol phosphatase [Chthoniobacteraceae bacterium]|nr:histidinol phosphatase [Chthoniobacteraceae bacterium]
MKPILYEQHMHTPLCKHALGSPEEYAAVARDRGLAGIVVTCHNPWPGGYMPDARMEIREWPAYLKLVARARETCAGWCDVRAGLEADFWPGHEEFVRQQVQSVPLHHVLGSVHPYDEYQRVYAREGPLKLQQNYFEHLAMAAETGIFDTIAHPDLIKNMVPDWNVERIMPVIQNALDRIAATGVAMELNTSGLNKLVSEMNPGPEMLHEMAIRGIPLVIGSDAHWPTRAAAQWEEAMDNAKAAGYEKISFFLDRQRNDVPIDVARNSLRPIATDPVSSKEWSMRVRSGR